MIRFAKVLEFDDHQFLIRSCFQPFVAGLPAHIDSEKFGSLLTIDTETPTAQDEPHLMRMVINCQNPQLQHRCFQAFNEVHCLEMLQAMRQHQSGKLTDEQMREITERIQNSLLGQVA